MIQRSIKRARKPRDNPVNESLNGWIKEELFNDFNLGTSHFVAKTIEEYVNYYNTKRPAYRVGYVTPSHYLKMFMNGEIEHKDTFSSRELSAILKFVKKKMEEKIQEEKMAKEMAAVFGRNTNEPSKKKSLETFLKATEASSKNGSN